MYQKQIPKEAYGKEKLFSYALWYTGKYRVSRAKLREKLVEKSTDASTILEVLCQIEPYHSDWVEIESYIESYLARAKPIAYVIRSLRQKLFDPDQIKNILQKYDQFDDYQSFSKTIEKRIQQLTLRGYWPKWIQWDLTQKYPQFRGQIELRCREIDEWELLKNLPKIPQEKLTQKEYKKIQDTLIRKGFSYQKIRKYLGGIQLKDSNLE